MSNPFDLLGNDVEDANDVQYVPKEIVKKSTSSKKTDAPPPSANKDRANKARPQPTGNEAAIKDKSAGRAANKAKGVEEKSTTRKPKSSAAPKDRHSRSGKTDSSKKVKQAGWTADGETELEAEVEGAEDAEEELKADEEPKTVKKSLEDYLKEKEATAFTTTRTSRTVEAIDDADIIVKEQESFIAPTKTKNLKSKALKTKNILEFDATFSDELPRERSTPSSRGSTRGRGGSSTRGRGSANNSTRGPRAPKQPRGPKIDDENFPSLA